MRVVRTVTGLILAAVAVGCGGDASEEPDVAEEAPAEVEWVAPRDTDVLLASMTRATDGTIEVGQPTNVTQRPDYDNQPAFTPDGSGLLYTVNDPQSGQADIWRYDLGARTVSPVTSTAPESEYSAAFTMDGSGVTVIRVEADSTQRLWYLPRDEGDERPVFADVAPVGYYAQPTDDVYLMFVLGSPPTLQRGSTAGGETVVITENIGRSIHVVPGTTDVSYVQRHDDGSSDIMRIDGADPDASPEVYAPAVADGDFHAWTPDGTLLMADGAWLYAFDPEGDGEWLEVADFSELNISMSRLAVHPMGHQIAIVAEASLDILPGN
ncbi:MAG: hypothetical protein AAF389_07105 [Gemmatimonadota bacterium]